MAGRVVQSFSLTKEDQAKIRALSKVTNLTMTDVVREGIFQFISALEPEEYSRFNAEIAAFREPLRNVTQERKQESQ